MMTRNSPTKKTVSSKIITAIAGLTIAGCAGPRESSTIRANTNQPAHFTTGEEEANATCKKAQALLAGIPLGEFENQLATNFFTDLGDFIASKPSISKNRIELKSFIKSSETSTQEYENLWCKLKSQDAIINSKDLENLPAASPGMNCDQVQEFIFKDLLANDQQAKIDYEEAGMQWIFDNQKFTSGQKWSPSEVEIRKISQNQIQITTSSLESPRGIPIIGGMHYCKFISTQGLKKLILLR